MPRHPAQRKDYRQDVVALGRLAMAVTLDDRIPPDIKAKLTGHLHAAINELAAVKLPGASNGDKAA